LGFQRTLGAGVMSDGKWAFNRSAVFMSRALSANSF